MSQGERHRQPGKPPKARQVAEFTKIHSAPPVTEKRGSAAYRRRATTRYKVELDVTLSSEHNFYAGFVENMSVDGVFVATHMQKEVGDTLELVVRLPNRNEAIRALGEVRWVREHAEGSGLPSGMGVHFIFLPSGCRESIVEFLSRREPLFYEDE